MNILYLAFARIPTEKAHGIQIMKTCEAFSERGATVTLCVPGRNTEIVSDAFSFYNVKKTFEICVAKVPDFVRFGPLGFFISLVLFSERMVWKKIFWSADVIFSRDASVLLQYLLLGRRLVYEAHTAPTGISKMVARRAWKVITISEGLKAAYVKAGVPEQNILVAHDAVDLDDFAGKTFDKGAVREKLGIPRDVSVAMYIGRVDPWKGVKTFLEASKVVPDVRFVVVGEGSQLQEFKKEYLEVIFAGPTPYAILSEVQHAANVLVVPNSALDENSKLYTSPLKVFAHMNAEAPLIASDLPSLREVLNESNAYLVTPDDPEALAQSIESALERKAEAKAKSDQASKDVVQYSWDKRADRILGFLKSN